jgi:hypothetical protein
LRIHGKAKLSAEANVSVLRNHLVVLLAFTAWAAILPAAFAQNSPKLARYEQQRRDLLAKFHSELDGVIRYCEQQGLAKDADIVRAWKKPVRGRDLLSQSLPDTVLPNLPGNLSEAERAWRVQLRHQRKKIAQDLYLLSRRLLNAGETSAAWHVLREVAWFDSDNERTRSILGFQRSGDRWVTPFEAKMIKEKLIWHDRFGWLPASSADRYQAGERKFGTRWITADREAAVRQNFAHAWEVETDHFLVKTNVSLEKGVEIAKDLEDYYSFFRRTYPEFFNSPEVLKRLFEGGSRRNREPFIVHFYRTRDEYMKKLLKDNPQLGITNGIYMPDHKIAYFYNNPDSSVESTLYHEATHQILYQLHPQRRSIGEREHFWIVEGLACYMESFRKKDGVVSIGDPASIRFQAARYRLLQEDYQVPLARLAEMGKLPFQNDRKIAMNYSQSSGLAHFFMHFDNGRYRDALIQHVALLYRPSTRRVRIAGLDVLTGVSYRELDEQYRAHLTQQAKDLGEQYPIPGR